MRKIGSMLLAAALMTSLLAGCGSKGGNEGNEGAGSTLVNGKYDPPITISIGKQQDENAGKYLEGESLNDNVLTRWGVENIGIKIETSLLGGDAAQYNNKLRLALTGSENLPNVIPVYDTMLMNDLIQSGRVKEITEDVKNYMPERLKEIYKQYPTTFNPVIQDGKVYGIAISPVLTEGQVMLIRQDWLDNLGLQAPTTIEEFEKVIAAFTNDDPDGNNKKDTYGFTFSGKDSYNTGWVSDPIMIFSAFTGKHIPSSWQIDEESGKLAYGSVNEGNREALATLSDWYSKGYLNKELATQGAWDAIADFAEGKAGIIVGRPWLYGSVSAVETNVSGAKISMYPTINGVSGDRTYQSGQLNDGVFMFSKDFNNMEAFFLYYDKLYDAAFGTGDFQYGYAQGYDYDIVNEEVVFDPKKFNNPMDTAQMIGKMAFTKNTPAVGDAGKNYYDLAQGAEPNTGPLMAANAADETTKSGYVISYENRETLLPSIFNGPPTKTMQSNWEQLTTMEKETYTKIIYSKEPIEAFDQFVKQWHEKGGDQITEEVNEWYNNASKVDVMSGMGLK